MSDPSILPDDDGFEEIDALHGDRALACIAWGALTLFFTIAATIGAFAIRLTH